MSQSTGVAADGDNDADDQPGYTGGDTDSDAPAQPRVNIPLYAYPPYGYYAGRGSPRLLNPFAVPRQPVRAITNAGPRDPGLRQRQARTTALWTGSQRAARGGTRRT